MAVLHLLLSEHHRYISIVANFSDQFLHFLNVCLEALRHALQSQLPSYVQIEVLIISWCEKIDSYPHIVLQRHVLVDHHHLICSHPTQSLPPLSSSNPHPLQGQFLMTEVLEHLAENCLFLVSRPCLFNLSEDSCYCAKLNLLA